jgi:phosphotriesterase-related protein
MPQVNTVLGPVDAGSLGSTLMHEHIFVLSPEIEKTAEEWDEETEQARAVPWRGYAS